MKSDSSQIQLKTIKSKSKVEYRSEIIDKKVTERRGKFIELGSP